MMRSDSVIGVVWGALWVSCLVIYVWFVAMVVWVLLRFWMISVVIGWLDCVIVLVRCSWLKFLQLSDIRIMVLMFWCV